MKRDTEESILSLAVQSIVGLLTLWAFIHAIRNRTAADFWNYSTSIAVVLGVIAAGIGMVAWFVERPVLTRKDLLGIVLSVIIVIPLMSVTYYAIGASLKDLFLKVRDTGELSWRAVGASLLVLVAGSLLFLFRLRLRSLYGATEAFVGVAVAMQKVMSAPSTVSPTSPDILIALLTASVYLVVRGFDNVHQGLTKPPLDPVAVALVEWIRSRSRTEPAVES